jgi:hypothetical protein
VRGLHGARKTIFAAKAGKQSRTGLRTAGLSLSLASGAYGASGAPAADMLSRNTAVTQEIALGEEAIFDVSLATFHVFDKETARSFRGGERLITFGGACCQFACLGGQTGSEGSSAPASDAYSFPPSRPTRPVNRHVRKKP